jgi:preprotein translocase subunit SecG
MKEQNTNKQKKQKENASPKHMSIRSILGGDILANDFLKRQTKLFILIMILTILYISNRYEHQQEMLRINNLKDTLIDVRYKALNRSSELMEKSRQSRIEEYISTKESHLETATNRPYLIKKD